MTNTNNMKNLKLFLASTILLSAGFGAYAQNNGNEQGLELGELQLHQDSVAVRDAFFGWWKDSQASLDERMAWYADAKFGCFVHWGAYSSLGGVWNGSAIGTYAEHVMRAKKIPLAEYKEKVVRTFNPVNFDADEWVRRAKEAGMKYFIVTAKHHDGFAVYHSDVYPYDMRLTPFSRDPMAELKAACVKWGLKFGFYYSHAFDWEHPDAPGNDWDTFDNGFNGGKNPGGDALHGGKDWWMNGTYKAFLTNADRYVNEKSIPQVIELVQKYNPDILWFDTPHKLPLYQNIRICKALREAKTDVVINGRLARWGNNQLGDYANSGDRAAYLFPLEDAYWESIPTTNNSYGYSSADKSHKPPSHFIRLLETAASKGGNILLNVGPKGDGTWDAPDTLIYRAIGEWMTVNGESIYGTVRTNDIPIPNWGVITRKAHVIYLHVHNYPKNGELWVGSLKANVAQAKILKTGELLTCTQHGKDLRLQVPTTAPDTASTVIALTIDGNYTACPQRLLDTKENNVLPTFDAILGGSPFSRGDGKNGYNYLHDWKDNSQTMTWNVSVRETSSFEVSIAYNRAASSDEGTVVVEVDNASLEVSYNATTPASLFVAQIALTAGDHVIKLRGKTYKGSQYMRPFSVSLTPVNIQVIKKSLTFAE
ncbi:hypothetical protein AGMMS49965_12570 [Bacteroidia bacterium]|nr:hypothetical protein AGMMS49965_12570 [Bacteroidia bacterium]